MKPRALNAAVEWKMEGVNRCKTTSLSAAGKVTRGEQTLSVTWKSRMAGYVLAGWRQQEGVTILSAESDRMLPDGATRKPPPVLLCSRR